jgi:prepilin-type N-terminal cleavage/methylation domain-containing protein
MDMIKKRATMRGQGGFTLVELLVAVAILAILAGVAVFAVTGLTDEASDAACQTEVDTIRTANASANATADQADTALDFLQNGSAGKFFTVSVSPAAGTDSNSRTATGTAVNTANPAPCNANLTVNP